MCVVLNSSIYFDSHVEKHSRNAFEQHQRLYNPKTDIFICVVYNKPKMYIIIVCSVFTNYNIIYKKKV